jgi:hypothetical protein
MTDVDSNGALIMAMRQPKYSTEEHARRGDALYESTIRPLVEHGNHGRIVAIDVDSGAFEVADDGLSASERLFHRFPDAQIWCIRIGHRAVHRFGAIAKFSATS